MSNCTYSKIPAILITHVFFSVVCLLLRELRARESKTLKAEILAVLCHLTYHDLPQKRCSIVSSQERRQSIFVLVHHWAVNKPVSLVCRLLLACYQQPGMSFFCLSFCCHRNSFNIINSNSSPTFQIIVELVGIIVHSAKKRRKHNTYKP